MRTRSGTGAWLRTPVIVVLTAASLLGGCSSAPPDDPRDTAARQAAIAFLDRYVDVDGRVVRRDQGGDSVSEGVSYALLLAQVAGDPERESLVWQWAKTRLVRPDGLLSFLAAPDGTVVDPQPATDADLVVAWALSRSTDAELRADATPLADAVRATTVVRRPPGPLLAAGPWAVGEPATFNPSYWVLPALRGLGMSELTATVPSALDSLTPGPASLPPDWARLDGERLTPSPDPGGRYPDVRYGLDAQRTTVWLAVDCDPTSVGEAASHAPLLDDRPEAVSRSQRGEVVDGTPHPLGLVAAAAAAHAGGDTGARDALLDRAQALDQEEPTYYGSAWVALGRALLQTDRLDTCGRTR